MINRVRLEQTIARFGGVAAGTAISIVCGTLHQHNEIVVARLLDGHAAIVR